MDTPVPPPDEWGPPRMAVPDIGPLYEVLPGLQLPSWVLFRVDLPEYPDLELHVRVTYDKEERVYEPQEIWIKTPSNAPEILRSIPLRYIAQEAMYCFVTTVSASPELIDRWRQYPPGDIYAVYRHPTRYGLNPKLVGSGPTDENLQTIARTYRFCRLVGTPPTKAIQEIFNLPRSTATRWVAAARKKGFLAADEVGRGGGAQSRYGSPRG